MEEINSPTGECVTHPRSKGVKDGDGSTHRDRDRIRSETKETRRDAHSVRAGGWEWTEGWADNMAHPPLSGIIWTSDGIPCDMVTRTGGHQTHGINTSMAVAAPHRILLSRLPGNRAALKAVYCAVYCSTPCHAT